MTARLIRRAFPAAVALSLLMAVTACAGPEPTYSSLSDGDMKALLPTESEIKTALGDINTVTGPTLETPKPNFTYPANEGMSQECYEAAYGTDESRAIVPTRMFVMQSSGSGGPSFVWVVTQQTSADTVRKSQDLLKSRLGKCDSYETFDAGTSSGSSFVTKPSEHGPGEGANAVITSGDVSMAFAVRDVSYSEAKELVKKMAPVMEKRLKASAPKS